MRVILLSVCLSTLAWGRSVQLLGRTVQVEEPDCYLPLDVLFLQDTTGSFWDDLPNVVDQIPVMINAIEAAHPDSWFGVAEFKDKPFSKFGTEKDYCFGLTQVLSPNVDNTLKAYKKLYASGGADFAEAQYQAIINAFEYDKVGWRTIGKEKGMAGARLVILSTDAPVHFEGELHQGPIPSSADHPYDPVSKRNDPKYQCENMRYPSAAQVAATVKGHDLQYLAILTPQDIPQVTEEWHWINEELLNQPASYYQYIDNSSANFLEGVLRCIAAVTKTACAVTTTPCPATTIMSSESSAAITMMSSLPTTTEIPTTLTVTDTSTESSRPTPTDSTRPTPTANTRAPCPCPCPQPCPSHCRYHQCCKNQQVVKVAGHPNKISVDFDYAEDPNGVPKVVVS